MWLLIRLRHDIDLLNAPLLIDLARKAILAGPLVCLPWGALLRKGILVVLALEPEGLVTPRQFQKAKNLLEGLAIDPIAFALVAGGGADVNLLRHLIQPAGLIAARETHEGAPLGELIEPCDFECEAQRIPSRQYVSDGAGLDALGVVD